MACLACMPAYATADEGIQAPAHEMEPVVVTASRYETPLSEVPGRVQVIDAERLKEIPFNSVDDILRWVSGVNVRRGNGISSYSSKVTMRGLGGNAPARTLIMVDGVALNKGDTGDVNWNRLNRDQIERIEIFKGPGSSIYGTNAMGGVINIITKHPDKRLSGKLSASYGSYDTVRTAARVAGHAKDDGKGPFAEVAGAWTSSEGYHTLTEASKDYAASDRRSVDEKNVSIKGGYDFDGRTGVEVGYSYFEDMRSEGYKYHLTHGSHRSFDTHALTAAYHGGTDDTRWNASAYFNQENYFWHRDFAKESSIYTVDSARTDCGGQIGMNTRIFEDNTLSLGLDAKRQKVDATDDDDAGNGYADNTGTMDLFGAYVMDEWKLLSGDLILTGGLRFDHARYHDGNYDSNKPPYDTLSGDLDENTWSAISPRAAARYFLTDDLSAYISWSRGFRAPILDSLCRNGIFYGRFYDANPDLENETIDTYEIGADAKLPHDVTLSASGFISKGDDFIYSVDTGATRFLWGANRAVWRKENVGKVDIRGVEIDATWKPASPLTLFANYTYTETEIEEFEDRPELEGMRLEYVPRDMLNVGATLMWDVVNTSAIVNYKGKQYVNDDNSEIIGSYTTLDLKFWRELDFVAEGLAASLEIQNVADLRYMESDDDKAPGRIVTAELSWTF